MIECRVTVARWVAAEHGAGVMVQPSRSEHAALVAVEASGVDCDRERADGDERLKHAALVDGVALPQNGSELGSTNRISVVFGCHYKA